MRETFAEMVFLMGGRRVFGILHKRDPLAGGLLCYRIACELFGLLARFITTFCRTRKMKSADETGKAKLAARN
jgi:hypothetical protein